MNRVDLYVSTLNSENTKKCYRRDIIAMLDFVDKKEEDINIADMLVWKESLSNQSSATIARKIAAVKMYFRFLHMNKIIEDDPAVALKAPKIHNKEKESRLGFFVLLSCCRLKNEVQYYLTSIC